MNGVRMIAIALIVGGIVALVYGGFSYTKEHTAVKLGSVELKVEEKKTINIPVWAGIGAILGGGFLALAGGRGR